MKNVGILVSPRSSLQKVDMITISSEIQAKRLATILRHISNVRESCELLGQRMIEQGLGKEEFQDDIENGRRLIANGQIHDNSKFSGVEWLYLHEDVKEKDEANFNAALYQHNHTNPHHPEYWAGGIDSMPRIYVAEMVCDWHARSSEFGSDLRDWVIKKATKKYHMNHSGRTYRQIKELLDMLLEKRFK
jgi:hypothetical protein